MVGAPRREFTVFSYPLSVRELKITQWGKKRDIRDQEARSGSVSFKVSVLSFGKREKRNAELTEEPQRERRLRGKKNAHHPDRVGANAGTEYAEVRREEERGARNYAEDTESTEVTEKKRRTEVFDRKSPPFPPEAGEGWGTLKFSCGVASEPKPKTQARTPCPGHPATEELCHDPSTARPDAPKRGAEEKVGPLRSG
jgi:hypothetical protein